MTDSLSQGNKRIARNTLYLYLRKIFTLGVGLYTSRALLHYLGVNDYGLYGLVGSVIVLFGSLRGLFSSTIQRYINFEKGRGNNDQVNLIFCLGLKIQIWIALIFAVVVEVAGLIMIPDLNIPAGSRPAAYVILQFSLLTAIVSILTVPYDAVIIAHERFNAYALFSVIEYVLKLAAVLLLAFSPISPVIYYALLLFIVSLIIRALNLVYCRRQFSDEVRYHNVNDRQLLKEMTGFAGWQFFGNFGFSVSQAGVNFILNMFGGVVVNAARTIALQFSGLLETFSSDLNVSFKPQIIDSWSRGDRERFVRLVYACWRITFFMTAIIAFPAYIIVEPLLTLWLGKVPPFAAVFVKAILFYMVVRCFHTVFDVMFKADGKLRIYQVIEFVCQFALLPISWLLLRFGAPFQSIFYCMAFIEIANLTAISFVAKKQLQLSLRSAFKNVFSRVIIVLAILIPIALIMPVTTGILRPLLIAFAAFIFSSIISGAILLRRSEQNKIIMSVRKELSKIMGGGKILIIKLMNKEKEYYPNVYFDFLRSKGVKIGKNIRLMGSPRSCVIDITRPSLVEIGDNVFINSNFRLFTHDYVTSVFKHLYHEFIPSSGAVKIGNNVSFAQNCTVLKGVTIGDNCFIGAGSIVTKDVPANSVAVGAPAKVVCKIEDYFERRKIECEDEAFCYARSIKERFNREPVASDFWEEFYLFVDASNIDRYPEIPVRQQVGEENMEHWLKHHKAKYKGLDEFLKAAFANEA